jgi:hypothetical protein
MKKIELAKQMNAYYNEIKYFQTFPNSIDAMRRLIYFLEIKGIIPTDFKWDEENEEK